ncbi:hypothetical protein LJC14_05520 [Treponema sp. OttesenSCG-928-L16]|nr:hypothetical protein [Treponema sp. OttesenSCG-928-L16]
MKKCFMLLLCLLLGTAMFAADFGMSFGGGFEFFGNWTTADTEGELEPLMPGVFMESDQKIADLNYGGFLFFDATYAELFVSVYGGSTKLDATNKFDYFGPQTQDKSYSKTTSSMNIGILGKYPFVLNKFTLYPLAGVSYQIFFSGDYGDEYTNEAKVKTKASDFNTLWFHVGGGVNYELPKSLYVKFEALYGFKLIATKYDTRSDDFVDSVQDGKRTSGWVNGFTARIGIGYKIK